MPGALHLQTFEAMTLRIDPSQPRRTIQQFSDTFLRIHPNGHLPVFTVILSGPPPFFGHRSDNWPKTWLKIRARVRSTEEAPSADSSQPRVQFSVRLPPCEESDSQSRSHKRRHEASGRVEDAGDVAGPDRRRLNARQRGSGRVQWDEEVDVQQAEYEAKAPEREAKKARRELRKALDKFSRKARLTAAEQDQCSRIQSELARGL